MPRRALISVLLAFIVLPAGARAAAARRTAPIETTAITGVAGWAGGYSYFNVRAAPRLDASIVGTLREGQRVRIIAAVRGDVLGGNDAWYRIKIAAVTAYVHSSGIRYISAASPWTGVVSSGLAGVDSRAAPRPDASSDASFAAGARMTVLGIARGVALQPGDDVWYQVSTGSYRPAYIYSAALTFVHPGAGPVPVPLFSAQAAFAEDMDSLRVLYRHDETVPWPPASLVKMMTAAVALDRLAPDTVLTVPAGAPSVGAAVGGTAMGLIPGERLSLRDLLYGMLLPSGNDAAYTIAEGVAGSQQAFAALMNAKAAALGMRGTHFVQGYGLDDAGQYSTARDLARLARYDLLHYPVFDAIVATTDHLIGLGRTHPAFSLHNRDQLLGVYPGAFGVKTGTTPAAGQNLVAAVRRDGHRIIVAVLGSQDRYADATALLNYAVAVDR